MPRKKPSENLPHALLAWAHRHREEMLRWIGRAVEIESPSFTKAAVDQMGEFLATEFVAAGGKVQIHRHSEEMLRWIGRAVEIESPSFTKAAVDQMGEFLATEFVAAGGKVQIHRHADA